MIVIGITDTKDDRNSHHDSGLELLSFMLKKFCNISDMSLIRYTKTNKPYIPDTPFSVSHSNKKAVCAINCKSLSLTEIKSLESENIQFITLEAQECVADIGVDIEYVDTKRYNGYKRIAEKKFFKDEFDALNLKNSALEYAKEFCSMWTKKESYGKLTGDGVVSGLKLDTTKPHPSFISKTYSLSFFSDCYSLSVSYK